MDVDSGRLITGKMLEELKKSDPEEAKRFIGVPGELNRAAKRKLAGKDEAMVSLTSGGKLSRWASKQRKKRKMKKQSRKNNR